MDFIGLPVKDMARAEEFYGGTLGLARNPSSDEHWAEFETGNLTIALSEWPAIGLQVPDVQQARRTLGGRASSSAARPTAWCLFGAASAIPTGTGSCSITATRRASRSTCRSR